MHIVLHPSSHNQPLRLEAFCVLSFCWNLQNDRRLLMSRIFHFSYYVFGVNYFTFCRQRGQCAPKKQTAPCCAASNFSGLETKVPSYLVSAPHSPINAVLDARNLLQSTLVFAFLHRSWIHSCSLWRHTPSPPSSNFCKSFHSQFVPYMHCTLCITTNGIMPWTALCANRQLCRSLFL